MNVTRAVVALVLFAFACSSVCADETIHILYGFSGWIWKLLPDESIRLLTIAAKDPVDDIRREAIGALGNIGPSARPAVPVLIQALRDPEQCVRSEAAIALGMIGPGAVDAVPALVVFIKRRDDGRPSAIDAVAAIGTGARAAVPVLFSILGDQEEHDSARQQAASVLWRIARRPEALDYLIRSVQGKDPWAAQSLGALGPSAHRAVPALRRALRAKDPALRVHAAGALWRITRDPGVIHVLAELGKEQDDRWVQELAVRELYELGPKDRPAVPALLSAVGRFEEGSSIRLVLGAALWRVARHPSAIPAMVERLATPWGNESVDQILEVLGPDAHLAVPVLSDLYRRKKSDPFADNIAEALTRIDTEAARKAGGP